MSSWYSARDLGLQEKTRLYMDLGIVPELFCFPRLSGYSSTEHLALSCPSSVGSFHICCFLLSVKHMRHNWKGIDLGRLFWKLLCRVRMLFFSYCDDITPVTCGTKETLFLSLIQMATKFYMFLYFICFYLKKQIWDYVAWFSCLNHPFKVIAPLSFPRER